MNPISVHYQKIQSLARLRVALADAEAAINNLIKFETLTGDEVEFIYNKKSEITNLMGFAKVGHELAIEKYDQILKSEKAA